MDRILVTGATGFIGRPTTRRLVDSGLLEVHTTHTSNGSFLEGAHGHACNLLSDEIFRLIRDLRPRTVLHLAWNLGETGYKQDVRNLDWAEATVGMLRHFAENGGQHFIFAGSSAEYFEKGGLLRETEDPQGREPDTLYGTAKKCITTAGLRLAQNRGFRFLSARIFPVYGPGYTKPASVIAYAIEELRQGRPAVCRSPHSVWDFIYIDDIARIMADLTLSEASGVINVASGVPRQMGQVFETIAGIMGQTRQLVMNDDGQLPRILVADVGRLRRELPTLPPTDFEEGLRRTVEWKTRTRP